MGRSPFNLKDMIKLIFYGLINKVWKTYVAVIGVSVLCEVVDCILGRYATSAFVPVATEAAGQSPALYVVEYKGYLLT